MMGDEFEPLFFSFMPGVRPQDPPEGGILAHEEFMHPLAWSQGEEEWQDLILSRFAGFAKGRFQCGDLPCGLSAVASEASFSKASEIFLKRQMKDAIGRFQPFHSLVRDAWMDSDFCHAMMIQGSKSIEDGTLSNDDLISPKFPLRCAADVILAQGMENCARACLRANRAVLGWNLLADWANALPESDKLAFLANASPRKGSEIMKRDLLERPDGLDGWIEACMDRISSLCGREPVRRGELERRGGGMGR